MTAKKLLINFVIGVASVGVAFLLGFRVDSWQFWSVVGVINVAAMWYLV